MIGSVAGCTSARTPKKLLLVQSPRSWKELWLLATNGSP
jgi:hypothetical protein